MYLCGACSQEVSGEITSVSASTLLTLRDEQFRPRLAHTSPRTACSIRLRRGASRRRGGAVGRSVQQTDQ